MLQFFAISVSNFAVPRQTMDKSAKPKRKSKSKKRHKSKIRNSPTGSMAETSAHEGQTQAEPEEKNEFLKTHPESKSSLACYVCLFVRQLLYDASKIPVRYCNDLRLPIR